MSTDDAVRQKYHSSRNVASGLLAAGPNIVVQRNDAYDIVFECVHDYLNRYFPGQQKHFRPLFRGKGFESIGASVKRGDYEAALIESMKRMIKQPPWLIITVQCCLNARTSVRKQGNACWLLCRKRLCHRQKI